MDKGGIIQEERTRLFTVMTEELKRMYSPIPRPNGILTAIFSRFIRWGYNRGIQAATNVIVHHLRPYTNESEEINKKIYGERI